ncbi:MAG TPA: hypothetical protein VGG39_31160 [Polyangiaceae bacterium]|jgi:hypothetical protein
MRRLVPILALGLAALACNGSTGDHLITFTAYARGATGAAQPFTVGDYSIQLSEAKMLVGAVYVDESPLGNQTGGPVCISPDVYAAQVPGPVEVDLLSDQPQEFSVYGQGTADTGLSWQMWLTDGDVNEANRAHVVDLQGTATRTSDGTAIPFAAIVTINDNRIVTTVDPADPGANPVCKQRIVLVGGIDETFFDGGKLTITIDPRPWFELGFDFASLPPVDSDTCLGGDTTVPVDPTVDYGSAQVCIPNTNYASGAGAIEGQELFTSIVTGGSAAYTLQYQ